MQFLERERITFVVVGGLANVLLGEPRSTRTEQSDRLDQAYIRFWIAQFAEILERPDWLQRCESLLP